MKCANLFALYLTSTLSIGVYAQCDVGETITVINEKSVSGLINELYGDATEFSEVEIQNARTEVLKYDSVYNVFECKKTYSFDDNGIYQLKGNAWVASGIVVDDSL
ncbi:MULTISPECIES: hypothetical protein [Vibrio]|uniref:hypothetical protein n=1 Tax=Vibrio TaxID=662 RepID=UPI000841AA09|nr:MULTISPECIES: hypothetical protein [Vibrio]ODM55873.1 hypothetical protein BC455_23370 [Vibrio harveyi]USD58566.1 hypothetical protein J4N44_26810 [Vibrio sp. SCSIO 43155]